MRTNNNKMYGAQSFGKKGSDVSGANIDNMSEIEDDSPRHGNGSRGSGIHTGLNPSVVTLGAKDGKRVGGASVPGTGMNTNDSRISRGAGGLAHQSSKHNGK